MIILLPILFIANNKPLIAMMRGFFNTAVSKFHDRPTNLKFITINTTATCMSIITGIPTVKYATLVLCLNRYIPSKAPTEPPTKASPSKVSILILDLPKMAFILSIAKAAKVIKLMIPRYTISVLCSPKNVQKAKFNASL